MAASGIPEEVFVNEILARLPVKALSALKAVSKNLNRTISFDTNFAVTQSRYNSSSSSTSSKGFISAVQDRTRLSCLIPPVSSPHIAIPDPALQFLRQRLQPGGSDAKFTVTASTNGLLLCLAATKAGCSLYVCNPATKESYPMAIPESGWWLEGSSVGLAFDPCTSPHHYTLVRPVMTNLPDGRSVEYKFQLFSSRRAHEKWVTSSRKVVLPVARRCAKPVFARGVLYWHCIDYLLWFDCDKNTAGHLELPFKFGGHDPSLHEIGVRDGSVVTWTRVSEGAVEVFELTDGWWEKRYCLGFDKKRVEEITVRMTDAERRRRRKRKRKRSSLSEGGGGGDAAEEEEPLLNKLWMQPLPFECGSKVYVRVKLRPPGEKKIPNYYHKMERLVSFDLATGEVTEECDQDELLIGYDNDVFGYNGNLALLRQLCQEEEKS